jgi:catechol 2,3-dioxygenase
MRGQAERAPSMRIDPDTTLGAVALTVSDLARSRDFYERVLGLGATELSDGALAFGAGDDRPLVVLHGDASALALDRRATGLFHLAILVPTRTDLGFALARLAEAHWPLDGASDHLVSEALYLSDPDGNGIEIYRDRPREEWRYDGDELQMATLPLDLEGVLGTVRGATELQRQAPAGTRIGHVHLQVADVRAGEAFYYGLLGFDVTVRTYPGALFVSAGGYHHHLGLNTWNSAGGHPPRPGAVGLRFYEIALPTETELERVLGRIADAGLELEPVNGGGTLVRDPSGIGVVLFTQ